MGFADKNLRHGGFAIGAGRHRRAQLAIAAHVGLAQADLLRGCLDALERGLGDLSPCACQDQIARNAKTLALRLAVVPFFVLFLGTPSRYASVRECDAQWQRVPSYSIVICCARAVHGRPRLVGWTSCSIAWWLSFRSGLSWCCENSNLPLTSVRQETLCVMRWKASWARGSRLMHSPCC